MSLEEVNASLDGARESLESQTPSLSFVAPSQDVAKAPLQDQKKLDAQRREGVIVHCFSLAEEVGLPGTQKLANALQEFETIFTRVFGAPPSAQDRADATVDFAKIAAATPSSVAAPAPAKG